MFFCRSKINRETHKTCKTQHVNRTEKTLTHNKNLHFFKEKTRDEEMSCRFLLLMRQKYYEDDTSTKRFEKNIRYCYKP
jgi:hypothetical protein